MALLANTVRNPKKKHKPYEPKDFNPFQQVRSRQPALPDELRVDITNLKSRFGF